jgi:two-component system, NtrC family, nitrogen regulation sensor histidine kinase GlnL
VSRVNDVDIGWSLFESSLAATCFHTLVAGEDGRPIDFTFDAVNESFELITGLSAAQVIGKRAREVFAIPDPDFIQRVFRVAETGKSETWEFWSMNLQRLLTIRAFRHKANGFGLNFMETCLRSNSASLEDSVYRTFFNMPNAVKLIVDNATMSILDANPKAEEFYGWTRDELRNMHVYELTDVPPEVAGVRTQEINAGVLNHFSMKHRLRNGTLRDVEVYTTPGPWGKRLVNYAIVHDVTETKLLERQSLQAERLRAVGELTTSLYHEFGNLLGILSSQIQLFELDLPEGAPREHWKGRFQDVFSRARKLVDGVKRFSKNQGPQKEPTRLSLLLEDLIELERPLCRERSIRVQFQPCPDDHVGIDAALVQQICLNLFKNSVEALEDINYPLINIEVLRDAAYVVLRFGDNGKSIPTEIRQNLFTPFFTTKVEGTGLGLSFCRTVAASHGGSMILEEGPAKFFQLRLPGAV